MGRPGSDCTATDAWTRPVLAALVAAALVADATLAFAGITSSTTTRYYSVGGTTQATLAAKMRSNPFRGDNGGAVANIRPKYGLKVSTDAGDSGCRVTDVDLKITFTLTLPRAKEGAMAAGTKSAWRGFVSFARRHEEQHRSIYMQCARNFVAKAQKLKGKSCVALQAQARKLLDAEDRACDKRHAAFDRSERRRLAGLSLFRNTRTAKK